MNTRQTIGDPNGPRIEMEPDWRLCRVLGGGTRALREAKTEFTPMTARERRDMPLYEERLATSTLHDVYGETVSRVASLPFPKPPSITGKLPPQLAAIETDADRCGTSLSVFGSQVYRDAIDRGLGLFLVDNVPTTVAEQQLNSDGSAKAGPDGKPLVTTRAMTFAEVEAMDARPYLSRIDPDNLVGWDSVSVNGREVCTELRVREWAYRPSADGPDQLVERVRKYTGTTVELWERELGTAAISQDRSLLSSKGDPTGWRMIQEPTATGFPDGEIPLVVIYTRKVGFLHAKPPFLPLAYLNVKHWNQQSVLDASIRFCLSPLLMLTGLTKEEAEQKPRLGEGATFASSSETAAGTYVEIGGASLTIAQAEIEKTEARMRARSADPLMAGSATATGEVRAEMKDQSEAQQWVETAEWAFYRAFQLAAKWINATLPEDFNVTLYRASSVMQVANPQRTTALQNDVSQGRLTLETYLKERARSGDFADDFDPTVEAMKVEEDAQRKVEQQMQALADKIVQQERQGGDPNADPNADPSQDPNADQKKPVPPQLQGAR